MSVLALSASQSAFAATCLTGLDVDIAGQDGVPAILTGPDGGHSHTFSIDPPSTPTSFAGGHDHKGPFGLLTVTDFEPDHAHNVDLAPINGVTSAEPDHQHSISGVVVGVTGLNSGASAPGGTAFACGQNATAIGAQSSAFGNEATAVGAFTTALGGGASAFFAQGSTAIGAGANVDFSRFSTATGAGADASESIASTATGALSNASHSAGSTATGAGSNVAYSAGSTATGAGAEAFLSRESTATGASASASLSIRSTATGANANAELSYESTATGANASASLSIRSTATGANANAERSVGSTATGAYSDVSGVDFATANGYRAEVSAGEHGTAIGAHSLVHSTNGTAIGGESSAGFNGTAVGSGAQANYAGSAAIGRDAQGNSAAATRNNEFVLGTANHSYTAPGITSDASRSFQSGPLEVVTTDSNGHLASDGGQIFRELGEQGAGIAIALALENPDLVGNEKFGLAANLGFFEGNTALGVALMGVLGQNFAGYGERWAVSGGVGVSLNENEFGNQGTDRTVAGRAGVQVSW